MKRSGSSFKMKQSTKRAMMNIMDAHERGEFRSEEHTSELQSH